MSNTMIETLLAERDRINRALAELGHTDDATMTDKVIAASESVTLHDYSAPPALVSETDTDTGTLPLAPEGDSPFVAVAEGEAVVTDDDVSVTLQEIAPDVAPLHSGPPAGVTDSIPPIGTNVPAGGTVYTDDDALKDWQRLDSDSRRVLATVARAALKVPEIAETTGGKVSAATVRRRLYGADIDNPAAGTLVREGFVKSAAPGKRGRIPWIATDTGRKVLEAGAASR